MNIDYCVTVLLIKNVHETKIERPFLNATRNAQLIPRSFVYFSLLQKISFFHFNVRNKFTTLRTFPKIIYYIVSDICNINTQKMLNLASKIM